MLVGFNIKFDLHWLRSAGFHYSHCRVWDAQLAHFILTGQSVPYPSLNLVAEHYSLGTKLDVVATEYWEKGIDTQDIPREVLSDYLNQDLLLTEQVYEKQIEDFNSNHPPETLTLFKLQCQDLLVLQEMEYNGMWFDVETAGVLAEKEEDAVKTIEEKLNSTTDAPINWSSRDHLSAYLYGGSIIIEDRMPIGVYKTGAKVGQTRYKIIERKFDLPQQVVPIKGSELKKEGYYATDDPTLKSLKGNKSVRERIDLILERAKSQKLIGTYYRGLPELIKEMDWPPNTIHGQFNQCVAATGRLSSSKPNLQNFAGSVDKLLKSRYV